MNRLDTWFQNRGERWVDLVIDATPKSRIRWSLIVLIIGAPVYFILTGTFDSIKWIFIED